MRLHWKIPDGLESFQSTSDLIRKMVRKEAIVAVIGRIAAEGFIESYQISKNHFNLITDYQGGSK